MGPNGFMGITLLACKLKFLSEKFVLSKLLATMHFIKGQMVSSFLGDKLV